MVSERGAPLNRRRSHHEGWRAGLRVRAYTLLSRALFPKSYLAKIMLGAFVGIPIPLLALVLYFFLIARIDLAEALPTLALVLVATVVGGALTLFALYALLAPVSAASRALRAYLERGGFPGCLHAATTTRPANSFSMSSTSSPTSRRTSARWRSSPLRIP
jgi:hypothetical protein